MRFVKLKKEGRRAKQAPYKVIKLTKKEALQKAEIAKRLKEKASEKELFVEDYFRITGVYMKRVYLSSVSKKHTSLLERGNTGANPVRCYL
jgi:hypothetical protein